MRKSRLKILVGITFSSLLICQMGVVPVCGAENLSLAEVEEEKWDNPTSNNYDKKGFRIQYDCLQYFDAAYAVSEEDKYNIKIPNNVIGISDGAFSGVTSPNVGGRKIRTVSIPRNVNEVGAKCFKDCTELTTVTFNRNLPYEESDYRNLKLGDEAFAGCTSLKIIDLSDELSVNRIKEVGRGLFAGCTSLQDVILSNGMTEIPGEMFKDCTSLKHLVIPDNISSIDSTAFDGTSNLTLYCKKGSSAAKAVEKYKETTKSDIKLIITDTSSNEKMRQDIEINLPENISIDESEIGIIKILCYHDDPAFPLNPKTTSNGSDFTFKSEDSSIVSVDENGLVTIHKTGKTHIHIEVEETYIFKKGFLNVTVIVTQRGEDPAPPDDNPDNPDNPSNPDNPNNPDSGTNTGEGDSNQNSGNENTNSSQTEEQQMEVKRIEVTYGDSPFVIQPGNDMGMNVVYSSSNKKVFVVDKNGKITIRGCGLAELSMRSEIAAKTIEIIVKPRKNNISTLNTDKRNITVKWKKDKKADGYYLYYSTNSKFNKSVKKIKISKNKTVKYTIKKLKSGKKYYVKICSYKKSGGNIIFGDVSKVKSIKVK